MTDAKTSPKPSDQIKLLPDVGMPTNPDAQSRVSLSIFCVKRYEITLLASYELLSELELGAVAPTRIIDTYIPNDPNDGMPNTKLRRLKFNNGQERYLEVVKGLSQDQPVERSNEQLRDQQWTVVSRVLSKGRYKIMHRLGRNDSCPTVTKDRYRAILHGHPAYVYVYLGNLSRLITVSFKFGHASDYDKFLADYNDGQLYQLIDPKSLDYNGCALAGQYYGDLRTELRNLGYRDIHPGKLGLRTK